MKPYTAEKNNARGVNGPLLWHPGLILGLHPGNESRCYFVVTSFIGWVQA